MRSLLAVALAALAAACGGSSNPCDGVSGSCTAIKAGASETDASNAFASAPSGGTIAFAEGTFTFTNTLTLSQKNVTVKGAGSTKTILDWSGQTAGSEGITVLDGSDGFKATALQIRNTKGNGLRVSGSNGVTFDDVNVQWTSTNSSGHGAYGLYPILCQNVLIDHSSVSGAADAGIYVGQSQHIIVRNSTASHNVAGIEIENSFFADVTGNTAVANTAGILVFDLPGLSQQGGHDIRVFGNTIQQNNTANFAAQGSIVSIVPAGTGSFVMANTKVEYFNNTVSDNHTTGFAVVSYAITGQTIPSGYNPFPSQVYAHDNTFSGNGTLPDVTQQLGLLLFTGIGGAFGAAVPTLLYDGILAPGASGANPMQICFKNNNTTYANLHFDQFNQQSPNLNSIVTTDISPVTCDLPALSPVTLP